MKARIIIFIAALAVAFTSVSAAEAKAIYRTGAGQPGEWMGSGNLSLGGGSMYDIFCEGPISYARSSRVISLNRQNVGRSPATAARYSKQDVWMQASIWWSRDGSSWNFWKTNNWQKKTVETYQYASFAGESFDVTAYPGLKWLIRVEFRWYIAGGAWLGTAFDGFTGVYAYGDNVPTFTISTGEAGCQLN